MKDISIIILNYNTAKFTLSCIDSIIEKTTSSVSYELIVIDNNSNRDDYNHLNKQLPKQQNIVLKRSIINLGFGGGNMFGAQFAKGNYLLFLNNDTLFINDCLTILKQFLDKYPKVGVATAQNFDENGNHVISFDHYKGIRKLIFGRGFLEKINPNSFPKQQKEYKIPVDVNFVNGAFLFFRSDVFAKVGGFDTNIFLYFEEMDICFRLLKIGYKSTLMPDAKITHFLGASTKITPKVYKEGLISYMYVLKKNYSFSKYLFIKWYLCITFLFKLKKWHLLAVVFKSVSLEFSLKQQQTINFIK